MRVHPIAPFRLLFAFLVLNFLFLTCVRPCGHGLGLHLRCLFPALNHPLRTHTSKNQTDAKPLHTAQSVAKPNDAQNHGQHFPGNGDGHEQQAGEMAQSVIDEDLTDGAAGGEAKDCLAYGWIALDESDCGGKLMSRGRREADQGSESCGGHVGG